MSTISPSNQFSDTMIEASHASGSSCINSFEGAQLSLTCYMQMVLDMKFDQFEQNTVIVITRYAWKVPLFVLGVLEIAARLIAALFCFLIYGVCRPVLGANSKMKSLATEITGTILVHTLQWIRSLCTYSSIKAYKEADSFSPVYDGDDSEIEIEHEHGGI